MLNLTFEAPVGVDPVADESTQEQHTAAADEAVGGGQTESIPVKEHQVQPDRKVPHAVPLERKFYFTKLIKYFLQTVTEYFIIIYFFLIHLFMKT